MVFWIGILFGAIFAWFAAQFGFYQTLATSFNITITAYVAIFLTPVLTDAIPAAGEISCGNTLTLATIAIAAFLILQGITYTFLPNTPTALFPRILNTVGSGVIGFLAGLLVWSLIAVSVSAMPIGHSDFAKNIGFGKKIEQSQMPYLAWWCNLVNTAVSSGNSERSAQDIIKRLSDTAEQKAKNKKNLSADPRPPPGTEHRDTDARSQKRQNPLRRSGLDDKGDSL